MVDLTQLSNPTSTLGFANSGKITASGGGLAVDAATHSGKVNFSNTGSGNITGGVALGSGGNSILLRDSSSVDDVTTGNGNNTITVQNAAKLTGTLTAGDGANTVNLKDTSQTNAVTLGNGGNVVNVYGGTLNGTLLSGSGSDRYSLIGVNVGNATPAQSVNAFSTLNGGAGIDLLTATQKT